MIAITGMYQSGTRRVTRLLTQCGLSLGPNQDLADENLQRDHDSHSINHEVHSINETIIQRAGGKWDKLPAPKDIVVAGYSHRSLIMEFGNSFTGDIFCDPRLCLTAALWERYCPTIETIVFCLRNPLAVAYSLNRNHGVSVETGFHLWFEYNIRFFLSVRNFPVIVVDYDNFNTGLTFEFSNLCAELGRPFDAVLFESAMKDFNDVEYCHTIQQMEHFVSLPAEVRTLYKAIRKQTYTYRKDEVVVQSTAA